ncbi:transposase [Oscillibacter sp. 1-3]|uniref:transposase n=1 Tax=Oscillibacter sp. 1-3 TaxID=1235797 RepID=UPI0009DB8EC4
MTNEQWNKVKDVLPPEKGSRVMLNGILYWPRTRIPWRDLPERSAPWKSVYTRFCRWNRQGVWEHVLRN